MKNLFALVGAATITFVGMGWYLGWYKISRQISTPGTQRFAVEVNPSKIATDGKILIEKVSEAAEHLSESSSQTAGPEPVSTTVTDAISSKDSGHAGSAAATVIQHLTGTPPSGREF